ncbi:MAG TPA: hypothetical protein VIV65_03340, partial [Gemmatimonadaceae bacterium]
AMGGVIFQKVIGRVLDANGHNYAPVFVVCGSAYLIGWIIIHLLAPTLAPAIVTSPSSRALLGVNSARDPLSDD